MSMTNASSSVSRRRSYFPSPRFTMRGGYDDPPIVNDELLIDLPPMQMYGGRLVHTSLGYWELWSPNSTTLPYYPGVPPADFDASSPARPMFFDGHLGRFDYTVSPQVFSVQKPWLPFIMNEVTGHFAQPQRLEFYPVRDVLTTDGRDPWRHFFRDEYVHKLEKEVFALDVDMDSMYVFTMDRPEYWSRRPVWPCKEDIASLRGISLTYDKALDSYTCIQRGVKERRAWITMVELVGKHSDWEETRRSEIQPANPSFIGTWINGVDERHILWLLNVGVPCFVIHELDEAEVAKIKEEDCRTSFRDNADVFNPSGHYCDNFALKAGCTIAMMEGQPCPPRLQLDPAQRQRSSSAAQGWWGPSSPYGKARHRNQQPGRLGCEPTTASMAKSRKRVLDSQDEGAAARKRRCNTTSNPNPCSAPSLSYPTDSRNGCDGELVLHDNGPYWFPPPVQPLPAPQKAGKKKKPAVLWWRFVEVPCGFVPGLEHYISPDQTAMVRVSADPMKADDAVFHSDAGDGAQPSGRHHYWDRKHRRLLSFNQPLTPNNIYFDRAVFGLPIPDIQFLISKGKAGCTPIFKSTWAYESSAPKAPVAQLTRDDCIPPMMCNPADTLSPDLQDLSDYSSPPPPCMSRHVDASGRHPQSLDAQAPSTKNATTTWPPSGSRAIHLVEQPEIVDLTIDDDDVVLLATPKMQVAQPLSPEKILETNGLLSPRHRASESSASKTPVAQLTQDDCISPMLCTPADTLPPPLRDYSSPSPPCMSEHGDASGPHPQSLDAQAPSIKNATTWPPSGGRVIRPVEQPETLDFGIDNDDVVSLTTEKMQLDEPPSPEEIPETSGLLSPRHTERMQIDKPPSPNRILETNRLLSPQLNSHVNLLDACLTTGGRIDKSQADEHQYHVTPAYKGWQLDQKGYQPESDISPWIPLDRWDNERDGSEEIPDTEMHHDRGPVGCLSGAHINTSDPGPSQSSESSSALPSALLDASLKSLVPSQTQGVKERYRGGIRQSLFKRFKKPFWDMVPQLTPQDLAELPEYQRDYINGQIAKRNGETKRV